MPNGFINFLGLKALTQWRIAINMYGMQNMRAACLGALPFFILVLNC